MAEREDLYVCYPGTVSNKPCKHHLGAFYFDPYRMALSFLHLSALKKNGHLWHSVANAQYFIQKETFLVEKLKGSL